MLKKIVFSLVSFIPLTLLSQFDMSMDRISTTDIPTEFNQIYYEPRNPTRPCINCPERENRWAHCSCPNLHIHDYCYDFQDDCVDGYYWMPYEDLD